MSALDFHFSAHFCTPTYGPFLLPILPSSPLTLLFSFDCPSPSPFSLCYSKILFDVTSPFIFSFTGHPPMSLGITTSLTPPLHCVCSLLCFSSLLLSPHSLLLFSLFYIPIPSRIVHVLLLYTISLYKCMFIFYVCHFASDEDSARIESKGPF